jgi:hypothetical protein
MSPPAGALCLKHSTLAQRMAAGKRPFARWYLLLAAPFVGTLWVPFYNAVEPRAGGIPFFYWYQFVWIFVGAVLTAVVYFATRDGS